ncbi:MAG: hypothetical protein HY726_01545 [Candidatus Rokubacteria bacterium]|nr:hypothetical protein [Candidatus Rokubacteria bacterium]
MISRGPVLELEIRERLLGVLEEVPFLRVKDWKVEKREDVDLVLQVTAGKEQWRLLVEVKQSGEPRIIRVAAQQLRTLVSDERQSYGVIGAPYISPRTAGICKEAGIGFLDLAGNCRLVFGQVFIERQGFPNPKLERRPLRALFAPKAGRVLRVLLEDPKRSCQVQVLARQAEVSLGLAFKVKQRLLDLEYAQEDEEGLRLIKPEELIRQWGAGYSYLKSSALDCYGPGDSRELEQTLVDYCRANSIRHALALFSGAARVAPFARYSRGFAYASYDAAELARGLGWKPVSSGANFTILTPFDEGLFYGARDVKGDMVVSDVQLYLDLIGYKGRGEEAATFILEQRLRPQW